MRYQVTNLSELESIPVGNRGLVWRPIRSRLGIKAFGVNAYTAEVGEEIVEGHTEESFGHEEIYVVVSGRATFTVDGDEIDAPAGAIVHLPDPTVRRGAVAAEPGTTVLGVGGKPGEAFRPSSWELGFRAAQLSPAEAVEMIEAGMAGYPETASLHYNLACFKALAGDQEGAAASLRRAFELDPKRVAEWAAADSDLASIRDEVSRIVG